MMRSIAAFVVVLAAASCSDSNNNNNGTQDMTGLMVGNQDLSGGGDMATTTGLPQLSTSDFPAVSPCPTTMALTDAAEFTALKTALKMGTITYHDLPFNGADADIYKKKCGLEGFWNPADNTDRIPSLTSTPELVSLLGSSGRSGICATYSAPGASNDGFPAAGVYRKQFQTAYMGATYALRTRVTVTGSAAGQTFASQTVTYTGGTNDVNSTLVYDLDGAVTPYASLWSALVDKYTTATTAFPTVTINVKKMGAASVIWTAKMEMICVSKM